MSVVVVHALHQGTTYTAPAPMVDLVSDEFGVDVRPLHTAIADELGAAAPDLSTITDRIILLVILAEHRHHAALARQKGTPTP